jgi:RNA-directed DNA polymerase
MKAKLREIKETLRRHRHTPIDEQGRWLGAMMKSNFAYFAVPTNTYLQSAFRYDTSIIWFRSLRRRSQRHRLTRERMVEFLRPRRWQRFVSFHDVDGKHFRGLVPSP